MPKPPPSTSPLKYLAYPNDSDSVPTHRDYPWERDERAAKDRLKRAFEGGGGENPPPRRPNRRGNGSGSRERQPTIQLSVGGQQKANYRRQRPRLKWPRLVMTSQEARLARFCTRVLTIALVAYGFLHHTLFLAW